MTTRTRQGNGKVKGCSVVLSPLPSNGQAIVETSVRENGDAENSKEVNGKKKKGNKKKKTKTKTAVEKMDKFELLSQCGGYLVLAQGSEVRECNIRKSFRAHHYHAIYHQSQNFTSKQWKKKNKRAVVVQLMSACICESAVQQSKNGQTCSFFRCLFTSHKRVVKGCHMRGCTLNSINSFHCRSWW